MRKRSYLMWAAAAIAAVVMIVPPTPYVAEPLKYGVVISAMYAGGGNTGATYTHDYIEIFNASNAPVDITDWSVQYANPVSAHWQKTFLPPVVLLPGQYLLARQDDGPHGTVTPPADAQGSVGMQGDGSYKVTIVRSRLTIHNHSPYLDPSMQGKIEDFFGGGVANHWEGQPANNGFPLNWTQAWYRHDGGCQDTDNNNNDFYVGPAYPNARSLTSPLAPCFDIGDDNELVLNGGLEGGSTGWTFSAGAKRKCGGFGDGSECAFKLLPKTKAQQRGVMGPIFASTVTAAGDVLQVSAAVRTKNANRQRVVLVVVSYVDPTAGRAGNGKDKFKLIVEQATTGYDTFGKAFTLDGELKGGRIVVANMLAAGTLRVDDVSVVLWSTGTRLHTDSAETRSMDALLPLPAAPEIFR